VQSSRLNDWRDYYNRVIQKTGNLTKRDPCHLYYIHICCN